MDRYTRIIFKYIYMNIRYVSGIIFILLPLTLLSFCNSSELPEKEELIIYFNEKASPLNDKSDLDELVELAGGRKLVLLGEATHGTSDFYSWRAAISKRLIEEKGFSFIAVEGDFASIYRLNKYVKDLPGAAGSAREVVREFDRWPQWMWANEDVVKLAEWMREYNSNLSSGERVGFYGMDVYGQWQAMEDLDTYAARYMPSYHGRIEDKLMCFAAHSDEFEYARSVARGGRSCREELEGVVELLRSNSVRLREQDERAYFRAKQNAIVVKNAEEFYRLAVIDNNESWNSRAKHMWYTVQHIMDYRSPDGKGVVWAHNTHIGDSRATPMHTEGRVNIGYLSRDDKGIENVLSVGFGTYTGRVNAGTNWGSRMNIMEIPRGMEGSYENILGSVDMEQFYLIFDEEDRQHELLKDFRGHRAIGVVYSPAHESGNYVPTVLPERYDAFIFIRETEELKPVE